MYADLAHVAVVGKRAVASQLKRLAASALSEGVTPLLVKAINVIVITLIGVLSYTASTGFGDVHTYVMLFLSVGLFLSVNWCVRWLLHRTR